MYACMHLLYYVFTIYPAVLVNFCHLYKPQHYSGLLQPIFGALKTRLDSVCVKESCAE
jgi:hypothetical protein